MTVAMSMALAPYQAEGFTGAPLTPHCAEVFQRASHVVLGVSPFNSYFKTERIVGLIDWSVSKFDHVEFFTPDEAAAYTLQAAGYDQDKAEKKARRQAAYVHNKIHTAIDEVDLDLHENVWGLEKLQGNLRYVELRNEAAKRFAEDTDMREAIMSTSSWILAGKLPDGDEPTENQVLLAVEYFLDELPLFIDSPGIFGVEASCFVYHQRVEFLERLYNQELGWKPAEGQGFMVVTDDAEPAA